MIGNKCTQTSIRFLHYYCHVSQSSNYYPGTELFLQNIFLLNEKHEWKKVNKTLKQKCFLELLLTILVCDMCFLTDFVVWTTCQRLLRVWVLHFPQGWVPVKRLFPWCMVPLANYVKHYLIPIANFWVGPYPSPTCTLALSSTLTPGLICFQIYMLLLTDLQSILLSLDFNIQLGCYLFSNNLFEILLITK